MIRERYQQVADHTDLPAPREVCFIAGIMNAVEGVPDELIPEEVVPRLIAAKGSVTVIATDKTGTLSESRMDVRALDASATERPWTEFGASV